MKLSRLTPATLFTIKQPRWRDRTVLLAKFKIGNHNEVVFTEAPSMPDHYYISGELAKSYPLSSNGKLEVYQVPINELEKLERSE